MLGGGGMLEKEVCFPYSLTKNLGAPSSSKEAETGKLKKFGSHRLDFSRDSNESKN